MPANNQERALDNRLFYEIDQLKRQVAELRTIQLSGSDVLAVTVANVIASGTTTLSAVYQDIGVSATVDLTVASKIYVSAVWGFDANGLAAYYNGRLLVDGVAESQLVEHYLQASSILTIKQSYVLSLAIGSHTFKMQAVNDTGAGGRTTTDSNMSYIIFRA